MKIHENPPPRGPGPPPHRARFISIASVYNSYARIYAQIWMKFDTYDHKIVIDHHIKFHEDLSFRCGDICKTIRAFVWSLIFNAFCIYSWFEHQNSLKIERLSKSFWWFFNANIKMETYQQKIPYNKSFNRFLDIE